MFPVWTFARSSSRTARPSTRGRCRSRTMRSGQVSSMRRSALRPSSARSTLKPLSISAVRYICRIDRSSSTTRMRLPWPTRLFPSRDGSTIIPSQESKGRRTMKARLLLAMFVLALAGVRFSAQDRAPQLDSIQKADLRADLYFLASDGMRGRLTDTPENALAAEWVKARFERLALPPAGTDQSYFHPYNLLTASLGQPEQARDRRAGTRDV